MADSNDSSNKMKELVVEEKPKEKNWNNLPFEMKEMVVKEMDLETRTCLKMCSKADKYLVESIPMSIDKLRIWIANRVVDLELSHEGFYRWIRIYAAESIVVISNSPSEEEEDNVKEIQCSNNEEAKKLVKQIFASIVFNKMIRFNYVDADIVGFPDIFDNSEFTMSTKKLDIVGSPSQVTEWLKNIAPGVEHVRIPMTEDTHGKLEGVGNIAAVVNAKELEIDIENDINDEQLANFKCTTLDITGRSNITGKGINQLIKKAISNDYPKGSNLRIHVFPNIFLQTWNDIIDGLDVKVTDFQDDIDANGQVELRRRKGKIKMKDGKCMVVSASKHGRRLSTVVKVL